MYVMPTLRKTAKDGAPSVVIVIDKRLATRPKFLSIDRRNHALMGSVRPRNHECYRDLPIVIRPESLEKNFSTVSIATRMIKKSMIPIGAV